MTIKEAQKLCTKIKCGYCLTHKVPFTCCNYMINVLVNHNGMEWCKKNINEFSLSQYEKVSDKEIGEIFKMNSKKTMLEMYEKTLFDFIEEV